MATATLRIRVVPFEPLEFEKLVAAASLAPLYYVAPQTQYLRDYFLHQHARARSIVIESPYVDRHYMEEYSRYYAGVFGGRESLTTRLHFFSIPFTASEWNAWLVEATADYSTVITRLQEAYLGFSVIRPIPSAPIGRTVLTPYKKLSTRVFKTAHDQNVHLCGLELRACGIPFQQQEIAVGACATTAVWSALASASRAIGQRSPTPYEVTEAATRHLLNDRAIPAQAGLELSQVLAAVRGSGFAPYVLKPREYAEAFAVAVKCYLASGFPVVLLIQEDSLYHAFTAVGYRDSDPDRPAEDIAVQVENQLLRTVGWSRLYIHEDRLGPYARFSWSVREGEPVLIREPFAQEDAAYTTDPMTIYAAVVPLYPKIRMSARGLTKIASMVQPAILRLVGRENEANLRVDLSFTLSGAYVRGLFGLPVDEPERIAALAQSVALPRYIGIVRYSYEDTPLADVICDSTDIVRDVPRYGAVLSLFGFRTEYAQALRKYAESLEGAAYF